jgi:dTDP-4-amino-4,6-dideoxygalactose transaminase
MTNESLAINGGEPLRTEPWPARGLTGSEERDAVVKLLDESRARGETPGYGGPEEEAFCRAFAELMGGGVADAVNSGTTAVYVALRALDLEPFTEVVTGCVTDPGGMMPIPLMNCIPVPADTAPGSFCAGPEQIEAAITPLTSAIVVTHIFGEPADMDGIMDVAGRHGLPVIEDCAQAHGALLNGRRVGAFGTLAAFSTMFGKHFCTGGQGGVVFSRDEKRLQKIRSAADRGKPFGLPPGSTNSFASLNLNLNELAATMGRQQLRKLPGIVERIRKNVARLRDGLAGAQGLALPEPLPGAEPSYWKLRVAFRSEAMTCDKATFLKALRAEGLNALMDNYLAAMPHLMDWFTKRRVFGNSGYPWASPDYRGDRDRTFHCPNAMAAMEGSFVLLCHEGWSDRDVDHAAAILRKVEAACRR